MGQVTSKDGTTLAFDQSGQGPAIILVVGAFNDRQTGAPLTQLLAQHFTVFNYDRRGRGDSGDTAPYAVEREIEDLEALIAAAGGSAGVFGYSSGAALALKAAASGRAITRLALYDLPMMVERPSQDAGGRQPPRANLADELADLIKAGRRGDAVELFQMKGVGIPAEVVVQLRNAPFRPALEKMAHTLVYEMTILGDQTLPNELAAAVPVPTLVLAGEKSPPFMQDTAKSLANGLPHGQWRILEGQTHDIVPAVMAPVLEAFFSPRT